jgi:phosphate/sulfate permease
MSLIVVIIILALVFDYINGFHDAANSIATVVSTKVLSPFQAVAWAAMFNFVAFFIFKDHAVANTISKTVHAQFITLPVIFSGLVAAIILESADLVVRHPQQQFAYPDRRLRRGCAHACVLHANRAFVR